MNSKNVLPKKRILIVDDEPDFLKLVEWQLMMNGYDVITAMTGTEGLKKAKEEKPDLIILETIMPLHQMNGVQMNERLKKDEATKEIPVIFFSNSIEDEGAMEEEGTAMLPKSVTSERLLRKIRELTSGRV